MIARRNESGHRRRFATPALAGVVLLISIPLAIHLPGGARAESKHSPVEEMATQDSQQHAPADRTFTPGIPGIQMLDVRDYKFLWREIEELQSWERGDRLSVAEFRSKVVEKTTQFLELRGPEADAFSRVSSEAVASIRESFGTRHGGPDSAVGASFSSDLHVAVDRVGSLLGDAPRHQLFTPSCKKWLLKLAFGPSEAKEAREREEARARDAAQAQESATRD